MEGFEEQIVNSLNGLNFIFRNKKITIECVNNFKGVSLFGESFGPYEKGKKYKLKLFSAIPFIENDIMKIDQAEKCDNIDVQRYAIGERDDQKLIERENNHFLNRIKEFRRFMELDIKKNHKPNIDLDRYNSYYSNIVDGRLLKILKLAKAELSLDDDRKFTDSEKLLYEPLNNIIKEWRQFFLSIR